MSKKGPVTRDGIYERPLINGTYIRRKPNTSTSDCRVAMLFARSSVHTPSVPTVCKSSTRSTRGAALAVRRSGGCSLAEVLTLQNFLAVRPSLREELGATLLDFVFAKSSSVNTVDQTIFCLDNFVIKIKSFHKEKYFEKTLISVRFIARGRSTTKLPKPQKNNRYLILLRSLARLLARNQGVQKQTKVFSSLKQNLLECLRTPPPKRQKARLFDNVRIL